MRDEFTLAAEAALRDNPSGIEALRQLEWLPSLDMSDSVSSESFVAIFSAQGRTLATTPAIGVLIGHELGMAEGPQDLGTVASFRANRRGDAIVATFAAASLSADRIVVDVGSDAVFVGGPSAFSPYGSQPLDPAYVNLFAEAVMLQRAVIDDIDERRIEARRLARLASSLEMLGVCEALMQVAVTHAQNRRQFQSPIGSFQAVQQILAAAEVELVGLRNCCEAVMSPEIRSLAPDPIHDGMLVKALAGRVSRQISQITLQVFGAVGFTWEHDHNRYQRRALTLDALFGSYDELVADLGTFGLQPSLRRVGVF